MLSSYILSLREGLEAALVLGIVLGALRQMRRLDLSAPLWLGAGSAALLSLLTAVLLTMSGPGIEGPGRGDLRSDHHAPGSRSS